MSDSLRVRPFVSGDREVWDAYVRAHPDSHFGQTVAWREVLELGFGARARYWLAEEAGRVRGVLPLLEPRGGRRRLFSPPGGLIADDEATAEALLAPAREALARERLDWIELRDQRRAWPGLVTSDEHVTMVLDLAESPEVQWKGFDAKLRNQIRKGEKAGFECRWGRDGVDTFHRVLLENMRDLGTPIRGLAYYRLALERLGPAADVLVIEHAGEPAGTMFTVTHRDTMVDPWASSLRRAFALCPNQVLYWEALRRAIALGLRRFDFGRSQRGSGTYHFKEQWGARPVPLAYQYALGAAREAPTLAAQKGSFELAVRLWQRLPLPLAAVLGEPARRRFPEVM